MSGAPPVRLFAIAVAAGAFSGLFGVGGGSVIVPLLILWVGYAEREATGTSLAAIAIIAGIAAGAQAAYGNVDPTKALLIGGPAVMGVIVGAAVQQRLPARAIAALFAVVLTVIAVELIVP